MKNKIAQKCPVTGHEECGRATAQILLLSGILFVVFGGTNMLMLFAVKRFYPVVYPGGETALIRRVMEGGYNRFLLLSFLLSGASAIWYMSPLYGVFLRWAENPGLSDARRRLLNAPVVLSLISFGGWSLGNAAFIIRMVIFGARISSLIFIKSVIIATAMQSLSVIITFYFMEAMSRRFLMPILFSGAKLSDCAGSIVMPIKARFLLYYFSVCIAPILMLCGLIVTIAGISGQRGLLGMTFLMVFFILAVALFLTHMIAASYRMPLVSMKAAAGRIRSGDYNVSVPVYSNDEIGALGEALNEMAAGLAERDIVKDAFSRYVTKQVADEILRNPDVISLGGKRQEVTILFADIRAFSAFSESHEPEEVISHLNEYLSAMVDVIFEHEGTLDKYIGDAIMVVYGSPLPHEDDALRAVRTALDMKERLAGLNRKWKLEGKTQLKVGIGVNTGDVIAGNIGDIRRMEYTVIGDNVNLASRVESLTKEYNCDIIISESVYEKVQGKIDTKKLGVATVKGKSRPVEIYQLLGMA